MSLSAATAVLHQMQAAFQLDLGETRYFDQRGRPRAVAADRRQPLGRAVDRGLRGLLRGGVQDGGAGGMELSVRCSTSSTFAFLIEAASEAVRILKPGSAALPALLRKITEPDPVVEFIRDTAPRVREGYEQLGLAEIQARWRNAGIKVGDRAFRSVRNLVEIAARTVQLQREADAAHRTTFGIGFWQTKDTINAERNDPRAALVKRLQRTDTLTDLLLGLLAQFCGWAVRQGLIPTNPVAEMQGVSGGVERERKALDLEEQRYLLDYTGRAPDQAWRTRDGQERCRVPGPERALVYRIAIGTGLRAKEIRSLTRASFQLARIVKGRQAPCVRLLAADEKNRKGATQPIQAGLAALLAGHLARKAPAAPAFTLPLKDEIAGMVRADLKAAREEWVNAARTREERQEREESYFLREVAEDGAVFDFHALRVTFITNMARAGVLLAKAVKLARHSDPKLTIGIYTKAGALDLDDAIDALPEFDAIAPTRMAAAV
ncbi:MAG: tyrosine-type recombinase/integrase [Phycisphaerales bacterium]